MHLQREGIDRRSTRAKAIRMKYYEKEYTPETIRQSDAPSQKTLRPHTNGNSSANSHESNETQCNSSQQATHRSKLSTISLHRATAKQATGNSTRSLNRGRQKASPTFALNRRVQRRLSSQKDTLSEARPIGDLGLETGVGIHDIAGAGLAEGGGGHVGVEE